MPKLIKDLSIVDNTWQLLEKSESAETTNVPAGSVIVPLSVWLAQKDSLTTRASEIGVWLDSDETADLLGNDAQQLALVAVNFPTFMDGRGFTAARLLRERFGFTGELRAIGGIIRDQLFYLKRCGFNAFQFADDSKLEDAMASLNDFSETYQAAADQPIPLFRRRA
jgi:uncharacterized protein (DUF934 family)